MFKMIAAVVLGLPVMAFAETKSIRIAPNTFSPANQRAEAPYVVTINNRFEITDPDDLRSLAGCYVSGNTAVRTALAAMVKPVPSDKLTINDQFNEIAADLQSARSSRSPASENPRFRVLMTTLSSLTEEVKETLEVCLNEE
jgi:hypothetical protein